MLPGKRALTLLLFAILAVGAVGSQSLSYYTRPYRQDEAWIVHANLNKTPQEIVVWVAGNIHPPLWMMTADVWVNLVGQYEPATRWLSVLFTVLSLALVFRLSSDLLDERAGLAAVFIMGTWGFLLFYSYEFRPYPALLTASIGVQFAFVRWLHRPDFKHALLFVIFGVLALYFHFFAIYLLGALFLFTLMFLRPRSPLFVRAMFLFALIGLSLLGWILPLLHAILVINPGGVDYAYESSWEAITSLYAKLNLRLAPIGNLLFITALLVPLTTALPLSAVRFNPHWRKWFPLIIAVVLFALAFISNTFISTLTHRNAVILLPSLAIFMGYALANLPRPARFAVIGLVALSAVYQPDYESPGPYADMIASMQEAYQPGSPVIVNIQYVPWHVPTLYYLQERLSQPIPGEDILQVLNPRQPYINFLPVEPVNALTRLNRRETPTRIREFIADAEQVWYITRQGDKNFTELFEPVIAENYVVVSDSEWGDNYQAYRIVEYRRRNSP